MACLAELVKAQPDATAKELRERLAALVRQFVAARSMFPHGLYFENMTISVPDSEAEIKGGRIQIPITYGLP